MRGDDTRRCRISCLVFDTKKCRAGEAPCEAVVRRKSDRGPVVTIAALAGRPRTSVAQAAPVSARLPAG